jgi:hypothetical protein
MTSTSLHDLTTLNEALAELPPLPMAALMIGVYNLLQDGADLPQPATSRCRRQASRSTCNSPASTPACGPSPDGRIATAAP